MFMETQGQFASNRTGDDRLSICISEDLGICVRSLVAFSAGDVLDRFSGDIGPELTQHSLQVSPGQHITGTRFVGLLSHSCDPNCRLDMERFELIARRDIAAGDLLMIDYAETEDVLYNQFACGCGASDCRSWIIGRKDDVNQAGRHVLAIRDGQA